MAFEQDYNSLSGDVGDFSYDSDEIANIETEEQLKVVLHDESLVDHIKVTTEYMETLFNNDNAISILLNIIDISKTEDDEIDYYASKTGAELITYFTDPLIRRIITNEDFVSRIYALIQDKEINPHKSMCFYTIALRMHETTDEESKLFLLNHKDIMMSLLNHTEDYHACQILRLFLNNLDGSDRDATFAIDDLIIGIAKALCNKQNGVNVENMMIMLMMDIIEDTICYKGYFMNYWCSKLNLLDSYLLSSDNYHLVRVLRCLISKEYDNDQACLIDDELAIRLKEHNVPINLQEQVWTWLANQWDSLLNWIFDQTHVRDIMEMIYLLNTVLFHADFEIEEKLNKIQEFEKMLMSVMLKYSSCSLLHGRIKKCYKHIVNAIDRDLFLQTALIQECRQLKEETRHLPVFGSLQCILRWIMKVKEDFIPDDVSKGMQLNEIMQPLREVDTSSNMFLSMPIEQLTTLLNADPSLRNALLNYLQGMPGEYEEEEEEDEDEDEDDEDEDGENAVELY